MFGRTESGGTVAWVESPFQLLSAIEAANAGLLVGPVDVLLRGSPALFEPLLAAVRQRPVAGLTVVPGASTDMASERLARSGELAIGDLCSGQAGVLAVRSPKHDLVVLDDGSSTLAALGSLADRRGSLVRPRDAQWRRRAAMGKLIHHVLHRRVPQRVRVVTGLPPLRGGAPALATEYHGFAWTRSLRQRHLLPDADLVVLGSALVADGLVVPERYAEWIERQLDGSSVRAIHLPHRRDDGSSAQLLRDRGCLVAETGGLPAELIVGGFAATTRIVTLPSTTVMTIPIVRSDLEVECWSVPDHWWTDRAPSQMRRLAADIAAWSDRRERATSSAPQTSIG